MNRHLSVTATAMVIVGIITMAVVPPVGLIIVLLAIWPQRRFRRSFREADEEAYAKAFERRRRERILAARSLP